MDVLCAYEHRGWYPHCHPPPLLSGPATGPSYLFLLFIVLGEAALQPQREFLELHDDIGIGGVVFEAHGVLHYVLHQEKCLLKVAHRIFLKNKDVELMVWLMWPGNLSCEPEAPLAGSSMLASAGRGHATPVPRRRLAVAGFSFFLFGNWGGEKEVNSDKRDLQISGS